MQISTNLAYQDAKRVDGYKAVDITKSKARTILSYDHCPAVLKDGKRSNANFVSSDWLWLDSDSGFTIQEFQALPEFQNVFYILYTSRNHQKQKGNDPAVDRFHVLFPVKTITDQSELNAKINFLIERYTWADSGAKGVSRLLYGNKATEVYWNDGQEIDLVSLGFSGPKKTSKDIFEDDFPQGWDDASLKKFEIKPKNGTRQTAIAIAEKTKEELILDSLRIAAERGRFDSYDDWIRIGMAMKSSDGEYSFDDWLSISHSGQDTNEARYKWDSFNPTDISGASVLHIAREVYPELLKKGSMPSVSQLIRIAPKNRSEKKQDSEHVAGYSTDAPTMLETELTDDRIEKVYEAITYLVEGKEERRLKPDWYLTILDHDAELANCAKYDYTIGGPVIAYSNTELLKTAIRRRFRAYGIRDNKISDDLIKRTFHEIMYINRKHNRVLAYYQMLKARYFPQGINNFDGSKLIEQFISFLRFKAHDGYTIDQIRAFYTEIFHIFFLRHHHHVQGTAIMENGEYYGLIANDIVPVLGGAQNIGKTTLCYWIAGNREDMYVDVGSGGRGGFGSSDTIRQVRGRAFCEIGEMKVMRDSSNVEVVKSFISKPKYELDVKYVEHSEPLPATVSYIGTSNPEDYLSDTTGNRRFYPINLESIDKDGLAENLELSERLQAYYYCLAETIPKEKRLDSVSPSPEMLDFIGSTRQDAMITYSDYDAILEIVSVDFDAKKLENGRADGIHKLSKAAIHKMVTDAGYKMMITDNSIKMAMQGLGYENKVTKIQNASIRAWVKKYL